MKGLMYSALCQAIFNLSSAEDYDTLSGDEFDFKCCFDGNNKLYDVARTLIICCMYAYLLTDYSSAMMFLNKYRPIRECLGFGLT